MLRVKPTAITLTHVEVKDFERRLIYRQYLRKNHSSSVSHRRAHSSDSHLPTDECLPVLTVVDEHELVTHGLDHQSRWRSLRSEPSSEDPGPIGAHNARSLMAFDQHLPPLHSMRRSASILPEFILEDDAGAVAQGHAPRGLQDASEELPIGLSTFELPFRSAIPSPISTVARTTTAKTGQSIDGLHSGRRNFLPHDAGTPADYDVGWNPTNPLVNDGPQIQQQVGHAIPNTYSPSTQGRRYRRRASTPDSPRAAPRPYSTEGVMAQFNTRVATSRGIPVYNDGGSTTEQPQTPQQLPEARHQSRFDGSYTAPVRERRDRTITETTSVDSWGPQARHTGSPVGMQRPGFQGLYGGIENVEEDWPGAEADTQMESL
ncbi:hypothetical protein EDB81DRAFT_497220 [Dactylonectria macrodidyma]|uniref:Uncharacterized protein n=1 Tax=Dactylonectria macrodidyma TaxID=307937 RepID=A0A9P9EXS3_9HYPO|nr:hypothetical protein EDB81DRAFT_497220 [Dactylonectria macrodidyma]